MYTLWLGTSSPWPTLAQVRASIAHTHGSPKGSGVLSAFEDTDVHNLKIAGCYGLHKICSSEVHVKVCGPIGTNVFHLGSVFPATPLSLSCFAQANCLSTSAIL